jgi:hypothetical protein
LRIAIDPTDRVFGARECAASSLDIEIMAWFETSQWPEFELIRQEILLGFMRVVEHAGASFAFPTQTLHIASFPPTPEYWPSAAADSIETRSAHAIAGRRDQNSDDGRSHPLCGRGAS